MILLTLSMLCLGMGLGAVVVLAVWLCLDPRIGKTMKIIIIVSVAWAIYDILKMFWEA